MAKYKTYAEYKGSGVEWLGEIPSHWEYCQLKRYLTVQSGDMLKADEITEEGIPIVGGNGYRGFTYKSNTSKNTIVIGRVGAKCGCVHIITESFWASEHAFRVLPRKNYNLRFMAYFLENINLNQYAITTAQPLLNTEIVTTQQLCIPTRVEEQAEIANFLDHETAKIDHLIEKQQQLIELLKEKRQAVISHAVTKGLDPNVPMKNSGVEWLGEVPEHWGILPIKYLTESVNTGGTPKNPISFTDVDEVNWFTPGDFLNDLEITVSSKYVTFDSVNTGDSKLYPRGSVLMIGIGATLGKIAICNTEFSCNQQINVLVPNRSIISEYLAYALIIQMDQIKQLSNSSTIGIINQEKTKQIVIALPALDEQVKIVEKITQKLLGFKKIIDLSEEQVELLKERRTALISAAVTGKIDVRNWQAPTVGAHTELSA